MAQWVKVPITEPEDPIPPGFLMVENENHLLPFVFRSHVLYHVCVQMPEHTH